MTKPLRFALVVSCFLFSHTCYGQNPFQNDDGTDIFGGGQGMSSDGGFGGFDIAPQPGNANATAAASGTVVKKDPDPVVRLLRESPPKTPSELADGLTWMVRIRRWDEVGRLLDSIATRNWGLEEKAELARAGGVTLWFRIGSEDQVLTDAHKGIAKEIARLPAQLARNPQWIQQWLERLASNDAGQRQLAQMRLQDANVSGVQTLGNALLEGNTQVLPGVLAETIVMFGEDGREALLAASTSLDNTRAARVILALADLQQPGFEAVLVSGLTNKNWLAKDREQLAEKLLRKYSSLPDVTKIEQYLQREFAEKLKAYQQQRTKESELLDRVWYLTEAGKLAYRDDVGGTVELEAAARVARIRLQMLGLSTDQIAENTMVLLQQAYYENSQLHLSTEELGRLLPELATELRSNALLERVFALANRSQMHGAALRAVQLMSTGANDDLLNFLSDRLHDPRPGVRYAALERIAKLDPKSGYRGSQAAIDTALEMTRLSGGPHALVIGLQADLREAATEQVARVTAGRVTAVRSARDALLKLSGDLPIEMILICDRVQDQSLFEFVQRLRRSANGESLPIAVLTSDLRPYEQELMARIGGVVTSSLTADVEQMRSVIGRLLRQLDTEPLNQLDRADFSRVASQFLARVAADRETYSFYSVASIRDQLVATSGGLSGTSRMQMLSGLGTGASQMELAEMSGFGGVSEQQVAARAFAKSLQRFGTQLDEKQVVRVYEIYNDLGAKEPSQVRFLGHVLDMLEAQSGKRNWPAGY